MEKLTQAVTLIVLIVVGGLFAVDKASEITNSGASKEIEALTKTVNGMDQKIDKILKRYGIGEAPDTRGSVGAPPVK